MKAESSKLNAYELVETGLVWIWIYVKGLLTKSGRRDEAA